MAKIIKVGSQTVTPTRVANSFRTSRNSTTNPFKYSNFEGNTLQFADVFEGFQPKSVNRMRMIASSVAGSMNKMRTNILEPIKAFAGKVRTNLTNAWDYAKNTNVSDLPGVKKLNDILNTPIEIKALDVLADSMAGTKQKITEKLVTFGEDLSLNIDNMSTNIKGIGTTMSEKWATLISKTQGRKISADMSVNELETLWKNEIALEGVVA